MSPSRPSPRRTAARSNAASPKQVRPDATASKSRTTSSRRPAATPARPAAAQRRAPTHGAESDGTDAPTPSRRSSRTSVDRPTSKAPWIIGGFIVLGVIAAAAYTPMKRSSLISTLSTAQGAEAIEAADAYVAFENGRENAVRSLVLKNTGPFAAQVHMAKRTTSLASLIILSERESITPAEHALALTTANEIFSKDQHRNERPPRDLPEWAEKAPDRDVANAALALLVTFADAGTDHEDTTALLSRLASDPNHDPLRTAAALDGLAQLIDTDTYGHAVAILRSGNADLLLQHQELCSRLRSLARPGNIASLLDLLDNPSAPVRTLALECLAQITVNDATDPNLQQRLGEQISKRLVPATDPAELAATLQAVKSLRLSGASPAVLSLAAQRDQLNLPGIDLAFWQYCLGQAFIQSTPPAAREASDALISTLATSLENPALRPVAAGALGLIREANFISLREAMDGLAHHLDEPESYNALEALVGKTFGREDVVKSCGKDVTRWQTFLAQDRPRYERVKEIDAFVRDNRSIQRISDGKEKLTVSKNFLEAARDEMQKWMDDPKFITPLGLTRKQIENTCIDVQELNTSVRKAWSGAL